MRDFDFRTRKPLRKFGVKSGLIQKRPKYDKKALTRLYVLRYLFIPTNSLLAAMSFFFLFCPLFFFFFFLILYALLLLNHKTSKYNFFSKVVKLQTQFCLPKYLVATPQGTLPKSGTKTEFFENEQNENRSN